MSLKVGTWPSLPPAILVRVKAFPARRSWIVHLLVLPPVVTGYLLLRCRSGRGLGPSSPISGWCSFRWTAWISPRGFPMVRAIRRWRSTLAAAAVVFLSVTLPCRCGGRGRLRGELAPPSLSPTFRPFPPPSTLHNPDPGGDPARLLSLVAAALALGALEQRQRPPGRGGYDFTTLV